MDPMDTKKKTHTQTHVTVLKSLTEIFVSFFLCVLIVSTKNAFWFPTFMWPGSDVVKSAWFIQTSATCISFLHEHNFKVLNKMNLLQGREFFQCLIRKKLCL
jgi:hypothetical protein